MGSVVYLTGAPSSGKSTLCKHRVAEVANLQTFSYGDELRKWVSQRHATPLTAPTMREASAGVVTADDVDHIDRELVSWVAKERAQSHIIVDSHPVTKEKFGFRITPLSGDQLRELSPDFILCLYASPEELERRIVADTRGRPLAFVV